MDSDTYKLWVKTGCPFCVKAQEELFKRKKAHTLFIMDEKPEELNEIKKLWDHSTVPIVLMQDGDVEIFIGGYTELMEWLGSQDRSELEND